MSRSRVFSLLLLTFLVFETLTAPSFNIGTVLKDYYDDGSEMSQRIIIEFMSSEFCQSKCGDLDRNGLLNEFQEFRTEWVDKMINFVIVELGLDAQSARHVRKNPSSYKVNYQTFKLLDFK